MYTNGDYNFDTGCWAVSDSRNSTPTFNNSGIGTLTMQIRNNGDGFDAGYIQTSTNGKVDKASQCLWFNPNESEYVQVRLKFDNCKSNGTSQVLAYVSNNFGSTDFDWKYAGATAIFTDGQYLTVNIPVTDEIRKMPYITVLRIFYTNVVATGSGTPTVTFDYIYMGPASTLPEKLTHTLTLINSDGTTYATRTVRYFDTYGDLPVLSKTGYIFNGWFTSATGGKRVLAEDIVETNSNETLYAQFSPESNQTKVQYAYTGEESVKITGWHHWSNNCLGGVDVSILGANEVSASDVDFRTNYEGTAGQVCSREMSNAPVATYYVDPADEEYSVSMLCEMTDNQWAKIINCQFVSSDTVQNTCSVDSGWRTQWYFKSGGEVLETSRTVTFTGKTPSAPGQSVDYPLLMYVDIANGQTGYIHAIYKMNIRFVAFGTTESGKETITNRISRNLSGKYCYDGTISAYNVDGGTNGSYNDGNDTNYSTDNNDFKLLTSANAYVYIDRSKYSNFEDTPVSFSHKVYNLCGSGIGGWAWGGIRVASTTGSFASSVGNFDCANYNTSLLLRNVCNTSFKICGALPEAGTPLTITVAGYYGANATGDGHYYNSRSNLNLTVYLYDKTQLNAKISELSAYTSKGAEYSAGSFQAFTDAYNNATAVANGQAQQSEIDTAKDNLINAFNSLKTIHTVTWKNYDGTVLETDTAVTYGTTPTYDGVTPIRPDENGYTYYFTGWTPDFTLVSGDVSYTAVYESEINHLILKEDSSLVMNENDGFIFGFSTNELTEEFIKSSFVNENVSVEKVNGIIGTGTKIVLKGKYGDVLQILTVVVFGDVNGDGRYDGMDAVIVSCISNKMIPTNNVSAECLLASDCNHDGLIDELDVEILQQAGLLLQSIDQTKSEEELLATSAEYIEYLNLIDQHWTQDEPEQPQNRTPIISIIIDYITTLIFGILYILKGFLPF